MAIVCVVLGAILVVAAWNSDGGWTRAWLAGWAAVNLLVAADMVSSRFEYAWSLAPTEVAEPSYRR